MRNSKNSLLMPALKYRYKDQSNISPQSASYSLMEPSQYSEDYKSLTHDEV